MPGHGDSGFACASVRCPQHPIVVSVYVAVTIQVSSESLDFANYHGASWLGTEQYQLARVQDSNRAVPIKVSRIIGS